ncbi:MAG: hypothetical protein P8Z35_23695 [Ignavibacteriaceae bacterium]
MININNTKTLEINLKKVLIFSLLIFIVISSVISVQTPSSKTYCNPMNIDYAYNKIPDFVRNGKHRTTADPVITLYKDKYFLFSTNQYGYLWSNDMDHWKFIPRNFLRPDIHSYDNLCAPAAVVIGDTLLVIGSTYTKNFPLWMSTNSTADNWKIAVDSFKVGA